MTLISALYINEIPILIGDLLISGQPATTNPLSTPTRVPFTTSIAEQKLIEPTGLRQKANILSSKIAIAWAGNMDEALSFYSQIIGSGVHLNPTIELIHEIYYDLDKPDELSLIGMFWCGDKIRSFWLRADKLEINKPPIQKLVVAGSGKEGFLKNFEHGKFKISSGIPNNLETAIGLSLSNISNLLMSEIATANTVNNYYGAGYEIIYPQGDHFEKFSDLTYVFWRIETENNTIVCNISPYLAMKYSYCGDLLLIRSIHLSGNKLTNSDYHVINPVYSTHASTKIPDFAQDSFNSKYMSFIFELKIQNQALWYSRAGRYTEANRPIIFHEDEKGLVGISVNEEFIKSIVYSVIQMD